MEKQSLTRITPHGKIEQLTAISFCSVNNNNNINQSRRSSFLCNCMCAMLPGNVSRQLTSTPCKFKANSLGEIIILFLPRDIFVLTSLGYLFILICFNFRAKRETRKTMVGCLLSKYSYSSTVASLVFWPGTCCAMFLGKTLCSSSSSLHQGVQMSTGGLDAGGSPEID